MSKLNKSHFLSKYRISEKEFSLSKLKWVDLVKVFENHSSNFQEFSIISNYMYEILCGIPSVHSIRRRIKDPEHLVEKIIRKSIEKPDIKIDSENYQQYITDLIGVRVLHLFKDEWIQIHNAIQNTWEMKEKPTANIRKGDNEDIYIENGCDIKEHKYGYRSVHYLIEFPYSKDIKRTVEIQVRTVFEEAWSEIDHKIRYPYDIDNPILAGYLVVFNGLAGSADQMGSFIKILKNDLDERNKQIEDKDKIIKQLTDQINNSKLDKTDKKQFTESLSLINNYTSNMAKFLTSFSNSTNLLRTSVDTMSAFKKINDIVKFNFDHTNTLSGLSKKISYIQHHEPNKQIAENVEGNNTISEEIKGNNEEQSKADNDEAI